MLCYSKDGLYASLTTLPSEALQTEALKLFKVKGGGGQAHRWDTCNTWVEKTCAVGDNPQRDLERKGTSWGPYHFLDGRNVILSLGGKQLWNVMHKSLGNANENSLWGSSPPPVVKQKRPGLCCFWT